jgi:hypothetical protein
MAKKKAAAKKKAIPKAAQRVAYISVRRGRSKQLYAVQVGGNGEDVNTSETYRQDATCLEIHGDIAVQLGVPLRREY